MYYQNSVEIFDKIKNSKRILINCHYYPDPDSVGSALALRQQINSLGVNVDVICPDKKLPSNISFLDGYERIVTGVDFSKFDFDPYDLVIFLDSPTIKLIAGNKVAFDISKIKNLLVIDHHDGNNLASSLKLMDVEASSIGEVLYKLFNDNNFEINSKTATSLLTAIFGDTSILTLPNATKFTYEAVADLVGLGADRKSIVMFLSKSEKLKMFKLWKLALEKINLDSENRFAYIFISYEEFREFKDLENAKAKIASLFSNGLINTDFGVTGIENIEGKLSVSFRARTDFDVSIPAKELGGGGHKAMSAALIQDLSFDKGVEKVLMVCRKYAKKD